MSEKLSVYIPPTIPEWVANQIPNSFESLTEAEEYVLQIKAEVAAFQACLNVDMQEAELSHRVGMETASQIFATFRPRWVAFKGLQTKAVVVSTSIDFYRGKHPDLGDSSFHIRLNALTTRLDALSEIFSRIDKKE